MTLNWKSRTMRCVNTVITALIFFIHVLLMNGSGSVDFTNGFMKEVLPEDTLCICLVLPPSVRRKYKQLL